VPYEEKSAARDLQQVWCGEKFDNLHQPQCKPEACCNYGPERIKELAARRDLFRGDVKETNALEAR
jgi:hypothetical protein